MTVYGAFGARRNPRVSADICVHLRMLIGGPDRWPICARTSCGIKSPNPFWLASAPPTDKEYNVVRAFKAGWGGVVWKTLGEDPPIVNVSSRYGALHLNDDRMSASTISS